MAYRQQYYQKAGSEALKPYLNALTPLIRADSDIPYVIWGHHALYLAFQNRPYWITTELDIVLPDTDLPRTIKALSEHGFAHRKGEVKKGMYGMPPSTKDPLGSFPEIARISCTSNTMFTPNPSTYRYHKGGSPKPYVLNLIPASLVKFNFDRPDYITGTALRLDCYSGVASLNGVMVRHPTIPGMMDAALSLRRSYTGRGSDLENLVSLCSGCIFWDRRNLEGVTEEEIRKMVLWQHGHDIWMQLKEHLRWRGRKFMRTGKERSEVVRRWEAVGGRLSEANRELWRRTSIGSHDELDISDDESDDDRYDYNFEPDSDDEDADEYEVESKEKGREQEADASVDEAAVEEGYHELYVGESMDIHSTE
ncbi:hypothetical protein BJ508DRAFT_334860 [Ascobolus immersus RN42]|uniref:Uncharacterized protein n=1 Tax=Ascobolus immersus RN42 TaxID=1160509 RepID=A0A3N4HI10_ASCIM|nr:hypothetical protein BJ508DRAFT_334860 [Ascobolus immersus RN42]